MSTRGEVTALKPAQRARQTPRAADSQRHAAGLSSNTSNPHGALSIWWYSRQSSGGGEHLRDETIH